MEETETKGKSRRRYLPLDQRIRLYDEVLKLRRQELTYGQIIERIRRLHGVRLYKTQIARWVLGIHHPLGNVNKFSAEPSQALAYIIGVKAGDGWLCKKGYAQEVGLTAKDYEFAAETGRIVARLLGRRKPYRPRWDKSSLCWRVTCCSVFLYKFLNQPWQNQRPHIEHCRNCVAFFLRAFFDGEGSIRGRSLMVFNTDKKLLLYVRQLLRRYFGIKTTRPRRAIKAGHRFSNPRNGKIYKTKKTCYYLYVPVEYLPNFHHYVGFTIKRKQRRLMEAIQK